MSSSIVSVPQFSTARILRPFKDYEQWYAKKSGNTLMMFSESGVALDEAASFGGYPSGLVKGCQVSLGSKVVLWIPTLQPNAGSDPPSTAAYVWVVSWRLRSIHDLAAYGKPAHIGTSKATIAGGWYPVPAAAHSVIYNSADPGSPTAPAVQNVYPEYFSINPGTPGSFSGPFPVRPFVPTDPKDAPIGGGTIQGEAMGTLPLIDTPLPTFRIVELCALGDEFTLGVYKSTGNDWGFDGGEEDQQFAYWMSDVALGVYAMFGVST